MIKNEEQNSLLNITIVDYWSWTEVGGNWDSLPDDIPDWKYWSPEDKDSSLSEALFKQIQDLSKRNGASLNIENEYRPDTAMCDHGGRVDDYFTILELAFAAYLSALTFLQVIKPILLKWMENRISRYIRIEKGDLKITIKNIDDYEKALFALLEFQSGKQGLQEPIVFPSSSTKKEGVNSLFGSRPI